MNGSVKRFVKEHHALYLLFWPFNFAVFFLSEYLAEGRALVIHSALDDLIPFSDFFVVFYVLWYPLWVLMLLYCFIREVESFRRMMKYFILTFTFCNVVYLVFPTMVDFPQQIESTNVLRWMMNLLYAADRPTNVFPSEHVIGAFAVFFAALDTKRFGKPAWSILAFFLACMISVSIMFTKQHSFIDLVGTLPLCVAAWLICFKPFRKKQTDAPAPPTPQ